jgi:hypothetical protein
MHGRPRTLVLARMTRSSVACSIGSVSMRQHFAGRTTKKRELAASHAIHLSFVELEARERPW